MYEESDIYIVIIGSLAVGMRGMVLLMSLLQSRPRLRSYAQGGSSNAGFYGIQLSLILSVLPKCNA